jgi:hypothetical protein
MTLRKLVKSSSKKLMEILDERARRCVEGRKRTPMKKAAEVDQALCNIVRANVHH